ncbi:MAG: DUF6428 family protein [Pseudomonadota bacterium]
MSTIDFFRAQLRDADFERRLVFTTGEREIGAGYHVTELKLANVTGIDCGANQSSWIESTIQLLDGHGGTHMKVGKFAAIVDQSVRAIPGLGEAELHVEYAPENAGKHLYHVGGVERSENVIRVMLQNDQARCKPASFAGCCSEPQNVCC